MRGTGTVISISDRYGFIRNDEGGADVFFSAPAAWGNIKYGSRVEFDLLNEVKPRACNVKVIK